MSEFLPVEGLVGGLILGTAASVFVVFAGRVAGISGIVGGTLFVRGADLAWRLAFIAGLIVGPLVVELVTAAPVSVRVPSSFVGLVVAGLLVGFGTRLGSGCTSGHGVCGIARLSPRSLAATGIFMVTGIATVFVVRHVMGLPTWP